MKELLKNTFMCKDCNKSNINWKSLKCKNCNKNFKTEGNVLIDVNFENIHKIEDTHKSNDIPFEYLELLASDRYKVLQIGAGNTLKSYQNSIELEMNIFTNTDIIADAHNLPFKDNSFDFVFAFNVFEHLENPFIAASEIYRVLKIGGKVIIHTAFLQPLHQEPHHYFNMTRFGVQKTFSKFKIDKLHVSNNFNVQYSLSWQLFNLLYWIEPLLTPEELEKVKNITIGELSNDWVSDKKSEVWRILDRVDPNLQERFAGGFEFVGEK